KSYAGLLRGISASSSRLFYLSQDSRTPPDVWTLPVTAGIPRRITAANPELAAYRFPGSRLVEWRSSDGTLLRGGLLLPADCQDGGRPCPLVVNVYAGMDLSNSVNVFGFSAHRIDNLQLLATRGYAVFLPDIPTHRGTVMSDAFKAVMPGIQKLVDLGFADSERIGVFGQDLGGYTALSLVAQTTRFKAAVMRGGFADPLAAYGGMGRRGDDQAAVVEQGLLKLHGTPWEQPMRYFDNSAFLRLDRVQTPLLIIHGEEDEVRYPFLADQVFVGLRRLGRKVEYAKYGGESHYEGNWSYANQVDYLQRLIGWFDTHLKALSAAGGAVSPSR
ncbi:MAG: alpha/beta hydrolase family protein, partial [Bryobacteraceae bacterium]